MSRSQEKPLVDQRLFTTRLPVRPGFGIIYVPVLDLIFLLIIFILLGSGYVYVQGVKIEPPEIVLSDFATANKQIITFKNENQIFFNEKPVRSIQHLKQEVLNVLPEGSQADSLTRRPLIILNADKSVDLDQMLKISQMAEELNIDLIITAGGK
ncbi:MAG: biopolymer transporter ExbD [Lentisphaeria bacterium]|nr:biopolymer transporter ExbD [Lentisphaeria bacterium]